MSWLSGYRAQRAITTILAAGNIDSQPSQQAVEALQQIGRPAIPKLLEAVRGGQHLGLLRKLLSMFVSDEALPEYRQGLADRDADVAIVVSRVLAQSRRFDPNALLDLFFDPQVAKGALVDALIGRADSLRPALVIRLLDEVESQAVPTVLRLVRAVATADHIPQLIRRLENGDPRIRHALAETLARFHHEDVQKALVRLLMGDPHKGVRLAALEGLLGLDLPAPLAPICQLLRDSDMIVQSKGIEALVRMRDPRTTSELRELLADDSESVRRAAIEALNELADPGAIEPLLAALRDADWWVRVRATDALERIGGPAVIDAVLPFLNEDSDTLRQAALDILQRTKDSGTYEYLVSSLNVEDSDRRLRAIGGLAALGDRRAVAPLLPFLDRLPDSREVVMALGSLGDPQAIQPLMARLGASDPMLEEQTILALEKLSDVDHARTVYAALSRLREETGSQEVRALTESALARLDDKYFDKPESSQISNDGEARRGLSTEQIAPADLEPSRQPSPQPQPPILINALTLAPGDLLSDRYRVIRQIGRGGFGVVVLVEDEIVREQIILKFPGPHVAPQDSSIERFKHELRYARKITHENVIRIYDLIALGSSFAISMEYFPSHTLANELAAGLPKERSFKILDDVLEGLAVAHRAGVVHRDLKPGNILIDDDEQVKIVDFGLASVASQGDSRLTRSGLVIGTPAYMAPEQVRNAMIDGRTDLYALGVLMYEMFSGKLPYDGSSSMSIMFQHLEGNPPLPSELNPDVSKALEGVILKAMSIDPEQRHQDAAELQAELREIREVERV